MVSKIGDLLASLLLVANMYMCVVLPQNIYCNEWTQDIICAPTYNRKYCKKAKSYAIEVLLSASIRFAKHDSSCFKGE